jgi:hypothetical protein
VNKKEALLNDTLVHTTNYFSDGNVLSTIGSVASIIGLLITSWVWFKVRHIEGRFLFKVRFPLLKRQLGKHSSAISSHLNSFPDSASDLEVELSRSQADLKSLKSKLTGPHKATAKRILKDIKRLPSPLTEECKQSIREVHLSLVLFAQELENLKEDLQWRSDQ